MRISNLYEECCIEMFQRVGLDKTYPEIKEFAKQPDWYRLHTWTAEEQNDFRKWLVTFMNKKAKVRKEYAEKEAAWFLLDIGWKVKDDE